MSLLLTPASCCGCDEACPSCSGGKTAISWGGCCNDAGEPDFSGMAGPQCPPADPVPWFGSCNVNCPRETIRYACCRIDGPSLSRTDLTLTHDGTPYSFPDSCIAVDGTYLASEGGQCGVVDYSVCILIAGTKKVGDTVSFGKVTVSTNTFFLPPDIWGPCHLLKLLEGFAGTRIEIDTRIWVVEGGAIVSAQRQSLRCFANSAASLIGCELDPDLGTTILDVSSSVTAHGGNTQFTYDMNLINDSASLAGKLSIPTPWLFTPGIEIGSIKTKTICTGT